jgi:hypothetical protein
MRRGRQTQYLTGEIRVIGTNRIKSRVEITAIAALIEYGLPFSFFAS